MEYRFIHWFFHGYENSKSGYLSIIDKSFVYCLIFGFMIAFIVNVPINEVSTNVIIPLSSILIGLTISLIGNAQTLLLSKEIIKLSKKVDGGYIIYIYHYQLSLLVLFLTISIWILVSFYDYNNCQSVLFLKIKNLPFIFKIIIKTILYSLITISIRESWSVVQSIFAFTIARNMIYEHNNSRTRRKRK